MPLDVLSGCGQCVRGRIELAEKVDWQCRLSSATIRREKELRSRARAIACFESSIHATLPVNVRDDPRTSSARMRTSSMPGASVSGSASAASRLAWALSLAFMWYAARSTSA